MERYLAPQSVRERIWNHSLNCPSQLPWDAKSGGFKSPQCQDCKNVRIQYLFSFTKLTILQKENISPHCLQRGHLRQQMAGVYLHDPLKNPVHPPYLMDLSHILPTRRNSHRKISRDMDGHETPLDSQADKNNLTPCHQETESPCHDLLIFCCSCEAHISLLYHFSLLKPFCSLIQG